MSDFQGFFDIACAEACEDVCVEWGGTPYVIDPDCCNDTELSQICGIYLDPCCQNPIDDWTEAGIAAWGATAIDNADTTGEKVKYIVVEGGFSEPTEVTFQKPKAREGIQGYDYTGTHKVVCIDPVINLFMRTLQKGNTNACFWFETLGGFIYGGLDGLNTTKLYAKRTYGSGVEDIAEWNIYTDFKACTDPPRMVNPFA